MDIVKILKQHNIMVNPFLINPTNENYDKTKYQIQKYKTSKVMDALNFAEEFHGEQKRKYTYEKYIFHPIEVMRIVSITKHDENMLMAALLHDTVEDTDATLLDIQKYFGDDVRNLVSDLTDISKPSDGNRLIRKTLDRDHSANSSSRAKTIKYADLISNTKSIVSHDKNFAKMYLKEKAALLNVMNNGDILLKNIATDILIASQKIIFEHEKHDKNISR